MARPTRRCAPLAVVVTLAGCGAIHRAPREPQSAPRTTVTAGGRTAASSAPPTYTPSAHHAHRVPHAVIDDEIGENIVGLATPYRRVVRLFGPPAARRRVTASRLCVYYRVVGARDSGWRLCFTRGRMTSATGSLARRDF